MNAVRTTIGVAAAAVAMAALTMVSASFAQDADHAAHHAAEAAVSNKKPAEMPMTAHMETMAKVKAALEEARGAAESQGDKTAVTKIDEALKLMEQDHQAMHKHMAEMMKNMKGRMEDMQAMKQEMQKMKEDMGKTEQTKPMQEKMEEVKKKMEKMHEQMKTGAKEGEMKCPMCKKMMGETPKADKVINARCPIMGTKIDPNNVPANLTREFKGQEVGFCCGSCPPAWDKLSDQQKQEKLEKAVAP